MNQEQMKAAEKSMIEWLSHPQELGKNPAKIQLAGEFDMDEMHYYIFKYKKSLLGKWLLGVCGGYEGDELEHCGHVFSQMQEYVEATAKEEAVKLVEFVKNYWKEQAQQAEKRKENPGNFVNFVLLNEPVWDKQEFLKNLEEEWQIKDDTCNEDKASEDDPNIAMLTYNGAMISVAFFEAPVPNGEAEANAASNFMWPGAVDAAKAHKAQLIVAIMGRELGAKEAGIVLAKVVATCCKNENVLGVYANETVYAPDFYANCSQMIKDDMFPVLNLVWFGLYGSEDGVSAYTCGLADYGKDEIEILNSKENPNDIRAILVDIALYVIENDVVLSDGETIGFTPEQKLSITKSRGVAVEGDSLKIGF